MLSLTHAITGAFIASKIDNHFISIPLITASHFLEDYIPHWDFFVGTNHQEKNKHLALLQEVLIDLPLSLLLVYLIFGFRQPFSFLPYLGWFVSLLPDFLEFPYKFLNFNRFHIGKLHQFHKAFHTSNKRVILGLLPQLTIVLSILLLK